MSKAEKVVSDTETELAKVNDVLKHPDAYSRPENKELVENWPILTKKLETAMEQWEEEEAKLETLENELKSYES